MTQAPLFIFKWHHLYTTPFEWLQDPSLQVNGQHLTRLSAPLYNTICNVTKKCIFLELYLLQLSLAGRPRERRWERDCTFLIAVFVIPLPQKL